VHKSTAAFPPHLSQPLCPLHTAIHLGENFQTAVVTRKSITTWSYSSRENSSEFFVCWHLPAIQPVAIPSTFHSMFCWYLHWLQWRKRCSHIWATVQPLPLHHRHLSSSGCLNCFRYVPFGAYPPFSLKNHVANDFTLVISTGLSLPTFPFSIYL
jgi:hypothetical protein